MLNSVRRYMSGPFWVHVYRLFPVDRGGEEPFYALEVIELTECGIEECSVVLFTEVFRSIIFVHARSYCSSLLCLFVYSLLKFP